MKPARKHRQPTHPAPSGRPFPFMSTAIVLLLALSAFFLWGVPFLNSADGQEAVPDHLPLFQLKMELLKESVDAAFQVNPALSPQVVFVSVTDTTHRAIVFIGTGASLAEAWENGSSQAADWIQVTGVEPVWVKVDVVDSVEIISLEELPLSLRPFRSEFFRKGIAFDPVFDVAFLEAEVNGNKLINYDESELDLENINGYLTTFGREPVDTLPKELVLFTCRGWFVDESSQVFPLYGYEGQGYDYGRRILESFDRDVVEEVIFSATEWLAGEVKDDGAFVYGYYPTYDRQFVAYNLLRHTVSIQPFIWHHQMTGSGQFFPELESTLRYLTEGHVEYTNDHTAYVIDRPNSEVKLGGNALAIITLAEYMNTFDDRRYEPIAVALGHGILELMDLETGTFFHVLHTDFTPKEAFRTVFYDGEAAYALSLLYEMTGDERWLEAAVSAVENFIREDYTRYRDHWVAYAMNEVTKHVPEQRYFTFALRNVQENLQAIYHRDTSYHTYLELLMASYELYHRIMEEGIQVDYLEEFDDAFFLDTIFHRAEHMLNGFFYPEYSMYLRNPQAIVGTFHIRHDGYRIRIDDVEHFIAGYYNFWRNYKDLVGYREGL